MVASWLQCRGEVHGVSRVKRTTTRCPGQQTARELTTDAAQFVETSVSWASGLFVVSAAAVPTGSPPFSDWVPSLWSRFPFRLFSRWEICAGRWFAN